jgi:hypothetical protein
VKTFDYLAPTDLDEALAAIGERPGARFLGGGTNLIDLVREGIEAPDTMIDVTRLGMDEVVGTAGGGVRIGAEAGLGPDARVRVASLLESYIFGMARGEVADRAEVLRTGESVDDYWAARASFWDTYFDPARFPTMLATWEGGGFEQSLDAERDLDFALDLILDSVERLVAATR